MSFSLSLLLIPYFAFLVLFFLLSAINLYHFFRFGFRTKVSFFMLFLFLGGVVAVFIISAYFMLGINWNTIIEL